MYRDRVTTVTAPAAEPVDATTAKLWLRVDHADDDTIIANLIKGARRQVELFTGISLVSRRLKLTRNGFPCSDREIRLPRGPYYAAGTAIAITYLDGERAEQTLDTADYYHTAEELQLAVHPVEIWPTAADFADAVRIEYPAGFATADIPAEAIDAIRLHVAFHYENRGDGQGKGGDPAKFRQAFEALLFPIKPLRL